MTVSCLEARLTCPSAGSFPHVLSRRLNRLLFPISAPRSGHAPDVNHPLPILPLPNPSLTPSRRHHVRETLLVRMQLRDSACPNLTVLLRPLLHLAAQKTGGDGEMTETCSLTRARILRLTLTPKRVFCNVPRRRRRLRPRANGLTTTRRKKTMEMVERGETVIRRVVATPVLALEAMRVTATAVTTRTEIMAMKPIRTTNGAPSQL